MLSDFGSGWTAAAQWTQAVLSGMGTPCVIALVLALTTLLVEDLAIAAGVALATQGAISWGLSLGAVGGGIAVGDLGLYGLGLAATREPWLQRRYLGAKSNWARAKIVQRLSSAVLVARVVPGLRLLTYITCGFVRVPLLLFTAWVLHAVSLWTAGRYALSVVIGQTQVQSLGVPPAVAVALPIVFLALAFPLLRRARQRFQRPTP